MKIQTEKPHIQRLHDRDIMEQGYEANFNDDGVATVTEAVGTKLVKEYESISEVES